MDDLGVESSITSKAMSVQVVQLSDMNRKLQVTEPAYIQFKCTYYDDNYQGGNFYMAPSEFDSGSNLQVEGFGYTAVVIIYPM